MWTSVVHDLLFFRRIVDKCEESFCPRPAFFSQASWTSVRKGFVHDQLFFRKHRGQKLYTSSFFFRRIVYNCFTDFVHDPLFFQKDRVQVLSSQRKKLGRERKFYSTRMQIHLPA